MHKNQQEIFDLVKNKIKMKLFTFEVTQDDFNSKSNKGQIRSIFDLYFRESNYIPISHS